MGVEPSSQGPGAAPGQRADMLREPKFTDLKLPSLRPPQDTWCPPRLYPPPDNQKAKAKGHLGGWKVKPRGRWKGLASQRQRVAGQAPPPHCSS